jgi:hypothetical protein
MRTLFFPGLVAQEVPSCQYLRVALLRVAYYTASVVLVISLLIEFNPIATQTWNQLRSSYLGLWPAI